MNGPARLFSSISMETTAEADNFFETTPALSLTSIGEASEPAFLFRSQRNSHARG